MLSALMTAAVLAGSPELGFAFSNEAGDRLLALTGGSRSFTKATCGGAVLTVKFEEVQREGPKNNARQTARNFAQLPGARFAVVGSKVPENTSCLLGTDAAFASRQVTTVMATPDTKCSDKAAALVAKLGKRKVMKCLTTGTFAGGKLHFAHFADKGVDALVGVVLEPDDGPAAMKSFAAKRVKDSPSCWRVDDGCEFDPSSYRVVAALTGRAGLELFALWGGAESENLELLRTKGAELMPGLIGSRYWSPE